jgi:hypothetical protein
MSAIDPQLPATPPTADGAAVPVPALDYQSALTIRRPGILTAVGVVSIVLASLSALGCLIVGAYMVLIWILLGALPKMAQSAPLPAGPLNAVQVAQVVSKVQSSLPQGLNPAQVQGLTAALQAPNQQLVPPQYAWSPVHSILHSGGGNVIILFNNGSPRGGARAIIGPTGHTALLAGAGSFPTNPFAKLKISRLTLAIVFGENIASMLLAIYLLILGILMLRDSPSSRRGHLRYAVIKIALSLIALVAGYTLGWQFISSINTRNAPTSLTLLPSFIVFAILTFAYPVALLITMNTAEVRRHYAEAG